MQKMNKKSIFVLILFVLITANIVNNFNQIDRVKATQEDTEINLEDLARRYKALNDELWELKQSRDRLGKRIEELEKTVEELTAENERLSQEKEEPKGLLHTITCYDLSEDSNGTWKGHPYYGLTANGFDLRGHTWETARTVAVDKSIYPLGTKLKLTFTDPNYEKYNGVYTARDTGGAIKGLKLDLFLGDFNQRRAHQSVWNFGKTQAYVEVVE